MIVLVVGAIIVCTYLVFKRSRGSSSAPTPKIQPVSVPAAVSIPTEQPLKVTESTRPTEARLVEGEDKTPTTTTNLDTIDK